MAEVTQPDPTVMKLDDVSGDQLNLILHYMYMPYVPRDAETKILITQLIEYLWSRRYLEFRSSLPTAMSRLPANNCPCSPFRHLKVINYNLSGSKAEGIDLPNLPRNKDGERSDIDIMYELGPVVWTYPVVNTETDFGQVSANTADPKSQPSGEASRLVIADTENPGFFLVLQERKDDCPHPERRPFKAEDVRQSIKTSRKSTSWDRAVVNGPACSSSEIGRKKHGTMVDAVPCLHVPVWWFSEEVFRRPRKHNWPSQVVLDEIRRYGLHLVPVGAHGSSTEQMEWRLSFSRAEVIISLCLPHVQQSAVVLLKACKKAMGDRAKVLRSYYAKTAMFWLCEEGGIDDWGSATEAVRRLLDFLEDAVSMGNLPCFFWSDINLLHQISATEREDLKETLKEIREHLKTYLACEVEESLPDDTADLVKRSGSEDKFRARLVSKVIKHSITRAVVDHLDMATADISSDFYSLLRSYPPNAVSALLLRLSTQYQLQTALFDARSAAPPKVASEVLPGPSGDTASGFVLDAAPLLRLLDEDDLKDLLKDPDRVRIWLKHQHQLPETERPAGLPADLRSPQQLCDLLLNIPLLVYVLKESVPGACENHQFWLGTYIFSPKECEWPYLKQTGQALSNKGEEMAGLLQSEVGVDRPTARQTASEMQQPWVSVHRSDEDEKTVRQRVLETLRKVPDTLSLLKFTNEAQRALKKMLRKIPSTDTTGEDEKTAWRRAIESPQALHFLPTLARCIAYGELKERDINLPPPDSWGIRRFWSGESS